MFYTILNLFFRYLFKRITDKVSCWDCSPLGNCLELSLFKLALCNGEHELDRVPVWEVGSVEGPLVVESGHDVLDPPTRVHGQVIEDQVHLLLSKKLPQPPEELLELKFIDASLELHHQLDPISLADSNDAGD